MFRTAAGFVILLLATGSCVHFVDEAVRQGESSRAGDPLPMVLQPSRAPRGTAVAEAAGPTVPTETLCPPRHVWQPVMERFRRRYTPEEIAERQGYFVSYLTARAQALGNSGAAFGDCYYVARRFAADEAGDERLPVAPAAITYRDGRWTFVLLVFRGAPDQRPSDVEPHCLTVDEVTRVVTPYR
jgi:hypothetical protein